MTPTTVIDTRCVRCKHLLLHHAEEAGHCIVIGCPCNAYWEPKPDKPT